MTTGTMNLIDTLLAQQLLSDEAPPCSSVIQTETLLIFTWRSFYERLVIEVSVDRRAWWEYSNWGTGDRFEYRHDADSGWPAEGKRYLMKFNRRAA